MVENVGEASEYVSRRKPLIFCVPRKRLSAKSWSYGGLMVVLRWSYDLIRKIHLELSTYKGTKNVRETSDIEVFYHRTTRMIRTTRIGKNIC